MKTALASIAIMAVLTPIASAVSVTETEDLIQVDTGPLRFGIRTGPEATLRWVEQQGRRIVRANEEPLLRARLMESAVYDGLTDAAPTRRFLDAKYHVQRIEPAVEARRFTAILHGHMAFDQGDRLPFTLRLTARTDAAELEIALKLAAEGDFRHHFLRDLVLQLPLDLNWRKRVAQGGDQGLEWDTRYYYEFPGRLGLLAAFGALYAESDDRFGELIRADMSDPGTGSRDAFAWCCPIRNTGPATRRGCPGRFPCAGSTWSICR